MKQVVISAKNISVGYPKTVHRNYTQLYHNLNIELFNRELTCFLGPNGAGKSTIIRTLTGIQQPLSGDVFLYNKPLSGFSGNELSSQIGVVLTGHTSVGGLTVAQLVGLGRYPYTGFFGRLKAVDLQIIDRAMEDAGIRHKKNDYMANLSDGEKQKAMIAKTLAQECPIIVLDEPTAYLDVASRIEVMDLLHGLAEKQNKAVLMSTHDIESALLFADRFWLLSGDRGLECGQTEDLLLRDTLDAFMGKSGIRFEKKTGVFLPSRSFENLVYVDARDEMYHWAVNFLRRNGYGITDNKAEAEWELKIISRDNIEAIIRSQRFSFGSFEELSVWIREVYQYLK